MVLLLVNGFGFYEGTESGHIYDVRVPWFVFGPSDSEGVVVVHGAFAHLVKVVVGTIDPGPARISAIAFLCRSLLMHASSACSEGRTFQTRNRSLSTRASDPMAWLAFIQR